MHLMDFVALAAELDASDELRSFRSEFAPIEEGLLYLDGNSLGIPPKASLVRAAEAAAEWQHHLVRGWSEWMHIPARIGGRIASLIGARAGEVVISDSTTVNLYKLVNAALDLRPDRNVIVTDDENFPSDLYVLQGIARTRGVQLEIVQIEPDADRVAAVLCRLGPDVALLTLSHVTFKSGWIYPMQAMTRATHEAGALVLWDLSHAVGAVPVELNKADADFAIGCTYKYLNGGPGAPAFLYVREDLITQCQSPINGWMGQRDPFRFGLKYDPNPDISRFMVGTPSILSIAAIEPGVEMVQRAGIDRIRAKSKRLTDLMVQLWEAELKDIGFALRSPREAENRGGHVSLGHPDALSIDLALINDAKLIPDFREPDNLRLGISPLTTSFADVVEASRRIRAVVKDGRAANYAGARPHVT
ncbi:MAG: kynureninase [Armatimonadetes bacterium]|nr:kynureninase [Armatimonadota bacterium]